MKQDAIREAVGLLRQGRLDEAERLCLPLSKGKTPSEDALQVLGLIASRRHEGEQAIAYFKRAAKASPRNARHPYLVAKTLANLGRHEEALRWYDTSLSLDPSFQPARVFRANALEWLGKVDEAAAEVAQLLEAGATGPDLDEINAKLLLQAGRYDEAIEAASRHAEDEAIEPRQRNALLVLKARALDKAGRPDEAFETYEQANAIRSNAFDVDAYVRLVDALIEIFDPGTLHELKRGQDATDLPVLIAGMPRSGTTLVEQIIDAHPDAYGEGEEADLDKLSATMAPKINATAPYPLCLPEVSETSIAKMARAHLRAMRSRDRKAKRIVNKNLRNQIHLGLAWMLMPGMRVIHCSRDPLDNCISCFTNQLNVNTHGYCTDQTKLGRVYRENERLMAHWKQVLDVPWLDVRYEDMVADQEGMSRRIIEFLGLDWDDACLRFHETGRVVMTLSYDQVRQPMYTSAVGRWRKYEKHLGPLKSALGID